MEITLTQAEKIKISNSEEIYQIMLKILAREEGIGIEQEHFWVVGLASDHMLLFVELISLGTNNRFIVEPREVFYTATNKNTEYVILVYNNTRGILEPSERDRDLTDQLMHAAELLYLQVIEHLIITKDGFYSFSMNGVLDELEHSKKYAVYFIEEEKIEKRGIEIGEKKGLKRGKIEMALGMKQKGIDLQTIKEISGLSIGEIKKL